MVVKLQEKPEPGTNGYRRKDCKKRMVLRRERKMPRERQFGVLRRAASGTVWYATPAGSKQYRLSFLPYRYIAGSASTGQNAYLII